MFNLRFIIWCYYIFLLIATWAGLVLLGNIDNFDIMHPLVIFPAFFINLILIFEGGKRIEKYYNKRVKFNNEVKDYLRKRQDNIDFVQTVLRGNKHSR